MPVLSALEEESADARDHTWSIDLDQRALGANMLAPVARCQRVPLSAGARLGPYEILAPLGSGGMGVVYRSDHSRLNRVVAIKVLGPSAHAAQHRQRFQREMRAIAALNHPHARWTMSGSRTKWSSSSWSISRAKRWLTGW